MTTRAELRKAQNWAMRAMVRLGPGKRRLAGVTTVRMDEAWSLTVTAVENLRKAADLIEPVKLSGDRG